MKWVGGEMARYKNTDVAEGQGLFLTVDLKNQLLPGTYEYMLNDLIGNKIDISTFDNNYKNDITGSKAIPPAVLLKLTIYAYNNGIISSRKIMELNQENIVAKSLTGDMPIHWTTIADFISSNYIQFIEIFTRVLFYCNELELIGGLKMGADGLRVSSNASMDMSGTKAELETRLNMYRRMAEKHVAKHIKSDKEGEELKEEQRLYEERQKYLNRQMEKIGEFLETMEPKTGKRAEEIKSNITDNESAMIKSSSGYLQGYIGIAVADSKNQIIMNAEAFGTANEGEHLPGLIDGTIENMKEAGVKIPEGEVPLFLMDANYFSEENLKACEEREVEALIPDSQYSRRLGENKERRYEAGNFLYHKTGDYFECPCGKKLEYKRTCVLGGEEGRSYQASAKDCSVCPEKSKCLRAKGYKGKWDRGRQLMITKSNNPDSLCAQMRTKLSIEKYQNEYAYRIQIIEPVFANIKNCKGMDKFTLRGKNKVNGQWNLYCIVHNLSKCLKGYNKEKNKKNNVV